MAIMDKMMDRMIKNMTVHEKEEMMLKMMPMMMKEIEIDKMAPQMMISIGRLLTITGIFNFLVQGIKDKEIREQLADLKTKLPEIGKKMQKMMSQMKPVMSVMMSGMMEFMGNNVMPIMIPVMHEMMPIMMREKMPEIMEKNDTIKEMMPKMMVEVIPDCVDAIFPMIERERRTEFILQLTSSMAKTGTMQMSDEEKKEFENRIVTKAKESIKS